MEEKYLKVLRLCMDENIPIHLVTEHKNIVAENAFVRKIFEASIVIKMPHRSIEREIPMKTITSIGIILPE